jgi:streptogramin lyase
VTDSRRAGDTSRRTANLRVVATGLRFPEGLVALADGAVLVVEIAGGVITRVEPDGTTSTLAEPGGGPNGLAVGSDGALYVCNNGGCFEWQDRFGLTFPGHPPPADDPGHGRGPGSRTSSGPRSATSTGSTTGAFTARSPTAPATPTPAAFEAAYDRQTTPALDAGTQ